MRVRDSDPVSRMPGDRTASESRHELGWPKFVDYAKNTLDKVDSFPYEDFVRNSAKLAKVSVYTVVHRWIPREDNIYGFLKVFRNGRGGVKQVSLNRDIVEEDYEN